MPGCSRSRFPTARGTSRGPARPAATRLEFQIPIQARAKPHSAKDKRGLIKDLIYDRVKAYVLKFAAEVAVDQAMKFLERNVRRGLVRISGYDPGQWATVENLHGLWLPGKSKPRVLLLVHGTFSSTAGSFAPRPNSLGPRSFWRGPGRPTMPVGVRPCDA